jgi:hypothetical protein
MYHGTHVSGNPKGTLDSAVSEKPGTVRVRGWDFDPNVPTQAIAYHVYIGGPAGSAGAEGHAFTANASRPDVGAAYPGVGNNHGFDQTITTSKRGTQSVYVYAINAAGTPGDNVSIGSKTVTIGVPRVYLTAPSAPRTAYTNRNFKSVGYLKPRYTAGTYPVMLYCYRYQSGTWVLRKSLPAKASDYSSYTKYSRSLRLPYRGKWRIRAFHEGDALYAATYSKYRYLTVK